MILDERRRPHDGRVAARAPGRSRSPATGRRRRRDARVRRCRRPSASTSAAAASLPAFTDATSTSRPGRWRRRDVRLEGVASLDEALARVAAHRPRRRVDPRPRLARRRLGGAADRATALDAVTGERPGGALVEGLPLALAQHARRSRAPAATSRCAGGVVERDAAGEPTGDPARGVGLALPRAARHGHRGRVGRGDARRGSALANARGVGAIHDKDGWLGAHAIFGRIHEQRGPDAARLAVAARRAARRARASSACARGSATTSCASAT